MAPGAHLCGGGRACILHRVSGRAGGRPPLEDAFEAAQWALLSSAGNALQQLGLRAAAGSPELAGIVRERQDLVAMVAGKEKALGQAGSAGADHADALVRLRGEIDSLRAELAGVDARLSESFPRYADLAHTKPLSVADVQALLDDDEGLLLMLAGHDHIFVWAVGKHDSAWTSRGTTRKLPNMS
ncbi:MAG: hypothetical protein EOS54_29155 [Mesorhizobium sp.]|uniref:hypothetical protein n=2 Tax=Mesorhizobium sp. TaxID=1871066 RepID=UPI000FEA7BE3|nr:hypothetical protein [Mesorhizobium sp.]RWC37751.1 MAG: hypothetical protein EOS54_29155 [Mesorhizobium sp.]RWD13205.1 MAG: hypothetical protein EOS74_20680 [Mesorhizobium sp.]RWD52015.1 MAG: hypothetical protein EOS75_30605 [Mesorhizobium sp.]TIW10186.1 MAG: hypothetical protein E5V66_19435 [Mesorhizobium sp.]TIX08267.1 MAG: hypothetical protein E5V46_26510 [Mesorhizobium sp.]